MGLKVLRKLSREIECIDCAQSKAERYDGEVLRRRQVSHVMSQCLSWWRGVALKWLSIAFLREGLETAKLTYWFTHHPPNFDYQPKEGKELHSNSP